MAGTALKGSVWPSPTLAAGRAPDRLKSVPALVSVVPVRLGSVLWGSVVNATLPRPVRTAARAGRAVRTLAPSLMSPTHQL